MSAVLEEKTVNKNVKTQPTLSQRMGYVLVQMGDDLEARIFDYRKQHLDNMDNVGSDLIADMDKRDITRLALLTGNDVETVKQDIDFTIRMLAWMHFSGWVKKPDWEKRNHDDFIEAFNQFVGCCKGVDNIDGLEYERKMREEVW
jgi:hypothetical protein